jgi:two-component system heavy metal sensor histidine kinase CusS
VKLRPVSLTLRVALLLSAVAVATFVVVGAYLYHTLQRQMAYRDDVELIVKVNQIRRVLADLPSLASLLQDQRPLTDTLVGHNDFMLRLNATDGQPLLQTSVTSRPLPRVASVPAQRALTIQDIHDWEPATGNGRMVRAVGLVGVNPASGDGGEAVQITLARERSDRLKLLRAYVGDLLVALCGGAVLATALGYVVVRYSMRQFRSVIAKADDINASRLNSRLSLDDAPAELRQMGEAFNAMLDRLEDGVQRLSGFAADLAHDMRTPVNTLVVETQVALSRPRTPEEYQQLLASNLEEYDRLARMIENTLFLARVDNAQLALQRETLDVQAELRRIHAYFEILAEDAGLRLHLALSPQPLTAEVDPVLLRRAVNNLVSNAIRYTPAGGAVTIALGAPAEGMQIAISNTGPGISPEHLPKIFERYYRGDQARSAQAHSAGLGLSIVRAIMELHRGTISVDSQPGELTTFRLLFKNNRNN